MELTTTPRRYNILQRIQVCTFVRDILVLGIEYSEQFTNAERVCRAVVNEHQRALLQCVELVAIHNVSWDKQSRDDRACCAKRPALPPPRELMQTKMLR